MKQWGLTGALVAVAYFVGRYNSPAEVKESSHVQTLTSENAVLKVQLAEAKERATQSERSKVRTEHYRPDGSLKAVRVKTESKRTTTERTDTKTVSNLAQSKDSHSTATMTRDVVSRRGVVIGPLAGLHSGTAGLLYGLHANKPFFGPVHLGTQFIMSPLFGIAGFAFVGLEL